MTQIATVERILDDTHAEISVPRKSACGHDCEECAGCGVSGVSVYVKALNTVGARPGQKVVVESDTKKMLKIVSFVYLIPVILFLAGYLIMLACNTAWRCSIPRQWPEPCWEFCWPSGMTAG